MAEDCLLFSVISRAWLHGNGAITKPKISLLGVKMTMKKTKHILSYSASLALALLMSDSSIAAEKIKDKKLPAKNAKEAVSVSKTPDTIELKAVTVVGEAVQDVNNPYNKSYTVTNSSTATKTDTPIMDTPVSIEVVTQEVLKDQQAFRFQDAVKNVSGVQQRFAGGGFDSFIIRGFEAGQFQYRNGIRIPNLNFDFANVQQVEVLKGPASSLYGRAEPGGLINAVTKRASAEPYYSLEQRFGSYDFYRTQANATGAITADESLLYRFDLSYLNSNSFREHSFNDRIFVAPTLTWKPIDSTEFNLTVEYLNEDRVYDSGIPAIGNKIAPIPITRQFDTPGLNDNHENILVDFNWSHQFNDDWKIQNGMVYMHNDQEWNETYAGGLQADNRSLERFAWFGEHENDLHTVYVNLTGKFDTFGIDHSVLIGGDFFNQRQVEHATDDLIGTIDIFNPVFPSNLNLAQFDNLPRELFKNQQRGFYNDREDTWYGIYFQDQMAFFNDKLHIMGGGRYDWAHVAQESAYFTPLEKTAETNTNFSPRVGVTYQPWKWLSLYGNFIESFGANNGRSTTGQAFDPQLATQYEAGLKTEFFDGRLTSTLAYYHLTKNNVLTPDPNNTNFQVPIGEARSQGIELDIAGQLTDALSLITTYAYTDARITKDNSGNEGNRLPYVPEHSGSAWLKYAFQQAPLQGFSVGAGVYAASKRLGDAANSFQDGAYTRLDLFGSYTHKLGATNLTAQVNINNVTDTEYFILRDRARNLPAEPLTVVGSLRLEY
ncbi:MAG: TonB-dependent siderophore receptor [Methylococcaceae bacterium]|nr:TonB-dependent siderophore receptor [Methylococcaceae bacterium]